MSSQDRNQEKWLKTAAACDKRISIFDNNILSPVLLKNLFQKVKDEKQTLRPGIRVVNNKHKLSP